MREKEIEKYLVQKINGIGGMCIKLVSPSMVGLPDRLVLLPQGHLAFVELKAPEKKSRNIQNLVQKRLLNLGFEVLVVDTKEGVDDAVTHISKLCKGFYN